MKEHTGKCSLILILSFMPQVAFAAAAAKIGGSSVAAELIIIISKFPPVLGAVKVKLLLQNACLQLPTGVYSCVRALCRYSSQIVAVPASDTLQDCLERWEAEIFCSSSQSLGCVFLLYIYQDLLFCCTDTFSHTHTHTHKKKKFQHFVRMDGV